LGCIRIDRHAIHRRWVGWCSDSGFLLRNREDAVTRKEQEMILDPEDEAFNEIERQAQQRKEAVKASVSLNPYRAQVIEEVAQHIEKMTVFGRDTVDSFAIYIRGMK
jgi:hypothetical protein